MIFLHIQCLYTDTDTHLLNIIGTQEYLRITYEYVYFPASIHFGVSPLSEWRETYNLILRLSGAVINITMNMYIYTYEAYIPKRTHSRQ